MRKIAGGTGGSIRHQDQIASTCDIEHLGDRIDPDKSVPWQLLARAERKTAQGIFGNDFRHSKLSPPNRFGFSSQGALCRNHTKATNLQNHPVPDLDIEITGRCETACKDNFIACRTCFRPPLPELPKTPVATDDRYARSNLPIALILNRPTNENCRFRQLVLFLKTSVFANLVDQAVLKKHIGNDNLLDITESL